MYDAFVMGRAGTTRAKLHSIAIELTPHCNQKCSYCYNGFREDNGAGVDTGGREALLARVTKLLTTFEIDHVTLTGGEPFAHPAVFEVLELLTAHGVSAQIISNGGLITDQIAERLIRYQVRYVQVTLNGSNQERHEEHVGHGHFQKTLRGVRALRHQRIPVVGCIVVTKKNARQLKAILELWRSLDVNQIALSRFSPAGYSVRHAAKLLPERRDLMAAFEQAEPFGRDGMTLFCTMPVPPCTVELERFPSIRFGTCPIGTSMQEFALGPDGTLRNCTLHGSAIGGVSDILDEGVDLAALVEHRDIAEYRRNIPEFCVGCMHADTCAGGCGAAAFWMLGDARRYPDPLVMQHVDDDFAERLQRERAPRKTRLEVIL